MTDDEKREDAYVSETSDEDPVEKKGKSKVMNTPDEDNRTVNDRDTRIQRQASMHFASRIVSAKIEAGEIERYSDTGDLNEKRIEEELNRWMTKFQRGITTGKIQ